MLQKKKTPNDKISIKRENTAFWGRFGGLGALEKKKFQKNRCEWAKKRQKITRIWFPKPKKHGSKKLFEGKLLQKCANCIKQLHKNAKSSMILIIKKSCNIVLCVIKYISLICVEARGCRRRDGRRVIFAEYVRLIGRSGQSKYHAGRACLSVNSRILSWQMLMRVDFGFLIGERKNARRGVGLDRAPGKRSSYRMRAGFLNKSQRREQANT